LSFALGAGKLFDLSAKTEFVETIICISIVVLLMVAKCVDRYIATQIHSQDGPAKTSKGEEEVVYTPDDRLEAVVERMFERCIEEKEYKQVRL
jgi:26S proteasome regulatory subunit N2